MFARKGDKSKKWRNFAFAKCVEKRVRMFDLGACVMLAPFFITYQQSLRHPCLARNLQELQKELRNV